MPRRKLKQGEGGKERGKGKASVRRKCLSNCLEEVREGTMWVSEEIRTQHTHVLIP